MYSVRHSIESSLTNFSFLSGSKVLVQATQLAILALITRQLGVEYFGKYNIFMMTAQFIFLISTSWTAAGFTRFSITYSFDDRPISHVFWARNAISAIFLLVIGLLVVFNIEHIIAYADLSYDLVALLFLFWMALFFSDYTQQIAQIFTSFKTLSVAQIIEKLLILLLLVLFGKQLFSIILLMIIVIVATRIVLLALVWKKLILPLKTSREAIVGLMRFSTPLLLVSIGGFIFGWVDVAAINHFMQIDHVGLYSLAYNGISAVESVVLLMATVLTPIFISLASTKRVETIQAFAKRILPQIQFLWGAAFIVLGWVSTWAIPLIFGKDFAASSNVFIILLIGMNFAIFSTIIQSICIGFAMVGSIARIIISAALLNLALDLILIPIFGIMGAAMATLISYLWISGSYFKTIYKTVPMDIMFPLLLVVVIAAQAIGIVMIENIPSKIVLSVMALIALYWISKGMMLFQASDRWIYERLSLPNAVLRLMNRVCAYYEK